MTTPDDPSPEQPAVEANDPRPTGFKALIEHGKSQAGAGKSRAVEMFEKHRNRPLVDIGLRIYARDRDAAGSVVGSAIAFRLFLFFVPLLLFAVGLIGFFHEAISTDHVEDAGITGNVADQINSALQQANSTRWIAVGFGLFGILSTGRTLSKAMTQASCLAWQLPIRSKASPRLIGCVIGLLVSMGLVSVIVNRVRSSLGLGVTGISFLTAAGLYALAWTVLFAMLPRQRSDPGVLLPGALLVAATVAGLQAVSQLYLPGRFDRASQLYGSIGVTIVILGWFFLAGRMVVMAMVLNAVIFERFGSITRLVFELPVIRVVPRKSAWLRRQLELDERLDDDSTDDEMTGDESI